MIKETARKRTIGKGGLGEENDKREERLTKQKKKKHAKCKRKKESEGREKAKDYQENNVKMKIRKGKIARRQRRNTIINQ